MTLSRIAAWIFLLTGAVWYVYDAGLTQTPNAGGSDFGIYRLAAARILHGESPHAQPGFIYPPLLAYLLVPLARIPYLPARWLWFGISQACLLLAAYLIWRKLGRGLLAACTVMLVWSGGRAAGECLAMGQVTPELTLLLALAYCLDGPTSPLAAGAAAAVKLIPGVLAIALVLARQWRAVFLLATAATALIAVPWFTTAVLLTGPSTLANTGFLTGSPAVLNWSWPAIVLRIMDPQPLHGPTPQAWTDGFILERVHPTPAQRWAGSLTAIVVFSCGLAGMIGAVRGRLTAAQLPLAMAALMTLTLVAGPISWAQYQTMQYPGIALLLGSYAASRQWRRFALATALAACLYPAPVEVLRVLYHRHEHWPDSAVTMYFWTSTAALAGSALYVLMLRQLSTSNARATSPATSSQSSSTAY